MEMQLPPEIKCRHENVKQIKAFRPQQTKPLTLQMTLEGPFVL